MCLNDGPSVVKRRTVRRLHLRGAGATCVLSLGRFQGDLCGVCLLSFAKCVASQWPTLSPVLRGFVFGVVFWFRPFSPPLVASLGPTVVFRRGSLPLLDAW